MRYRDFDLLIDRAGDAYRAQVLNSPAGQGKVEFRLPFSDLELENWLLRLGRPRATVRRLESTEMSTAKALGGALFNAVFDGDVRGCLRSSMDETKREGVGLRIRLRLADASLADLPWEFLYNASVNRFLALSIHTPLVRYMDLPQLLQPIGVTPPINVLVMISSPTDYPALDVEAEWQRLNEALGGLVESGLLTLERLDDATLPALQRRLRRDRYHIFHFIGHGEFDQSLQEGVLLLERDSRRGHRVGSQYLGMLLHDHESLRVAVLNACEGARTSRQDPFAGSAQTLVQQGIPAVIAMQFEIADDVAGTFAHEFYGAVADGYPVDAAVTEARKAIFAAGREVEWATPVLYLRSPDGRIFDVEATAVAPRPEQPPASRTTSRRRTGTTRATPPPAAPLPHAPDPLRAAERALAIGDYVTATEHLRLARELDPTSPVLADLVSVAEGQRAVAATRARLRATGREHVTAAAAALAAGDLAAASKAAAAALRLKPGDREAQRIAAEVTRAMAAGESQPPQRGQGAAAPAPSAEEYVVPPLDGETQPQWPDGKSRPRRPRPAAHDEGDLVDS